MKIFIDAGHRNNINDFGASGNGQKESALALLISKKLKQELEKHNIVVYMSRELENDVISLAERTRKANNLKVDLYVSVHINSASNKDATGLEVLYWDEKDLSSDVCNRMCEYTAARNRGAKQRKDLAVLRDTDMTSILIECGFISNAIECKKLADTTYQDKLVKGIVGAIISKYKIVVQEKGTPIICSPTGTVEQAKAWAKSKKATQTFIDNATYYWSYCKSIGINPVIAYVQYAKESGYGKFGGVLNDTFNNPCGLKIPTGGDCKDPDAHMRFATWEQGISAHIDHLALYAGASGYPKSNTMDPRHFSYLTGKCKTVESLGGNWCPDKNYGDDLVRLMKEIESIKVEQLDEYKEAVTKLSHEFNINDVSWYPEPNLKNLPALVQKIGRKWYGINDYKFIVHRMYQDKIISNTELWLSHEYNTGHIKSLIKKIAARLG